MFSIYKFKTNKTNPIKIWLIAPITLFVIIAISYFWSIDIEKTIKFIPLELALLLIPLLFYLNQDLIKLKRKDLLESYSWFIVLTMFFFITRAFVRFLISNDANFFFYHGEYDLDTGLVPKTLNAIHVSFFVSIALFYFITQIENKKFAIIPSLFLGGSIVLLSSKNILIINILLIIIFMIYFSKSANSLRLRNLIIFFLIIGSVITSGKIKQRFKEEFQANTDKSLSHDVINNLPQGVHIISLYEAWNNKSFTPNDYFPGTAFRVYQARMFCEIIQTNPNLIISGTGFFASQKLLEEKANQYNVYKGTGKNDGYQNKNFHNQYIQIFAEVGIIGLLILLFIIGFNLKKSLKNKDFVHIAFAVLTISVFLTESFLWRQRGVVFFITFYCLFNMDNLSKNEN